MKARWQTKKLGQIISLEYGKPLEPHHREINGLYPVYGANGAIGQTNKFYHDRPSIVVGRKGSAGEINLTAKRFWPLDVTYFVTFDESNYVLKFIYYLLSKLNLPSLAKGVKPGINRNEVYELDVNIPSIQEQERIVAILDQAFEVIAKVRANVEQNLQNVRALFESHLQSVFTQRIEGWTKFNSELSDLCALIVDCEHKTAPTQETGIASIRTPNIGKGELLLEGVYRVSDETYIEWTKRAIPQAGDLILAREAPAGNIAVIPENTKVCLGQRTVLIRPKTEIFNAEFLCFYLLQPEMQSKLSAHSRGATVQHVNMKDIRALKVDSLPNLELQNLIVANIKEAKTKTNA